MLNLSNILNNLNKGFFSSNLVNKYIEKCDRNFVFGAIGFQAPASPVMEGIIDLHNNIFILLILVFVVVLWMYGFVIFRYFVMSTFLDSFLKSLRGYFLGNKESALDISFRDRVLNYFYGQMSEKNTYNTLSSKNSTQQYFLAVLTRFFKNSSMNEHVNYLKTRNVIHGTEIEIIWTIIPSIILLFIALPSFSLLYAMDEIIDPRLTIKAIGYQWFWTYEYGNSFDEVKFDYLTDSLGYNVRVSRDELVYDSVMLSEDDLLPGYHRLLDVDHQLILPTNVHIRVIVTASDVLHSFAVPSLGVKIDAVPGRLSQVPLFIKREGVFYGQCSELCGVNHGFMPIVIKAVSYDTFMNWYANTEILWNN
jgi:cytochrome c oxidase subunit 2